MNITPMEWASEKGSAGSDDSLLKWLTEIQEEYLRLSELTRMERAAVWALAGLIAGVQRSVGRPIPVEKDALAGFSEIQSAAVVEDSLVIVDGTAFVVSVSNRTVVTAVGSEHMKDNVFTNIDSAVIA